jgi:hypothetical protein
VVAATEDLVHLGFERDDIFVFCGDGGAERLVESSRPSGILGQMYRFVERVLSDESEERQLYAAEISAGRFVITVTADDAGKAGAADVLANHGGHDMEHSGRSHGEPLGSSPLT